MEILQYAARNPRRSPGFVKGNIQQEQRASVFRSVLFGSFAVVSILLSAAGMYGVMAYTVAQRSFEFGLRFAFGAQKGQVFGAVLALTMLATLVPANRAARVSPNEVLRGDA